VIGRENQERLSRLLHEGERFALLTHVNADGDGLGSQMALYGFLRARGKQARMINHDPVPANYRFLQLAAQIEVHAPGAGTGRFIEEADAVFVLDNGSVERLGSLAEPFRASPGQKVCIDHHETRDDCWDLELIDPGASASGEIVHEIIDVLGGEIDAGMAEAIYVSIVTDTGHFRFSKTRPLTHRIAARMLEKGVRPDGIYDSIYENHAEGFVRLMGEALRAMTLDAGGALAWVAMDREMLDRLEVGDTDTGPIVNLMLSVAGVRAAFLFKELEDGGVKVSLRSKGAVDVHALARRHGGGGHRNASGIQLDGPLEGAVTMLLQDARRLLEP
jgi:phosphoesterase RecJ-like protein